jgi:hypothetical protein
VPFKNAPILFLSEICLIILVGCEVPTSVRLAAGPSFSFDGSGRLVSFSVYGPRAGHRIATPLDTQSLMWRIEPTSDSPSGALVASMDIAYGNVPKGYTQKAPSSGTVLPLTTGVVYAFAAETTGAPGVNGFVYIGQTGPVRINVPGLCESAFVGDERALRRASGFTKIHPGEPPATMNQFPTMRIWIILGIVVAVLASSLSAL